MSTDQAHPVIDTAVIPVAGLGTRMGTFTEGVPKFMAPVYIGKEARPAIDFMLDECLGAGIKHLIFVHSDGGDQVLRRYLGPISPKRLALLEAQVKRDPRKQAQLDKELARRQKFAGIKMTYIEQPAGAYGTAVPIALAKPYLEGVDYFMITGGDDIVWYPDGHSEWSDALVNWNGEDYMVMGYPVSREDAPRFGILIDDGTGNLKEIVEKPAYENVPANPTLNAIRYLVGPKIWPHLEAEMNRRPDASQPEHYMIDVINQTAKEVPFKLHTIQGAYLDCGSPQSTAAAGALITAEMAKQQNA